MTICTICQSGRLAQVEAELGAGAKVREVATRYGFSKSAVGRHRSNCLAPKLAAAARIMAPAAEVKAPVARAKSIASGQAVPTAADVLGLEGLLARLARSLDRLERAADAAGDDGLHAALAAVSGQIHRGIEVAGKMQGIGAMPSETQDRFSISIVIPTVVAPGVQVSNTSSGVAGLHPATPAIDITPGAVEEVPVAERLTLHFGHEPDLASRRHPEDAPPPSEPAVQPQPLPLPVPGFRLDMNFAGPAAMIPPSTL